MNDDPIISRAHDWRQSLPLSASMLVCANCGIETKIGEWGGPRCASHYEDKDSGFLNEQS